MFSKHSCGAVTILVLALLLTGCRKTAPSSSSEAISPDQIVQEDGRIDAEAYFQNYGTVLEKSDAGTSADVLTYGEAVELLNGHGFSDVELTASYAMDGSYQTADASADPSAAHPMYDMMYKAENGDMWSVSIVGKTIFANPVSYNWTHFDAVPVMVAETKEVVCYDSAANSFFRIVPKETEVQLMTVKQISPDALDGLSGKEQLP